LLERLWRALTAPAVLKAHERIRALGSSGGKKRESLKEEKAHEGRGLQPGLNRLLQVRTFAGSKALKWDESTEARFR
jgi:hypothetical protein